MTMWHDLLTTELLTVRTEQGTKRRLTLPQALAGLASGTLLEFARVRSHQFDAWMMFLTQLAAHGLRVRSLTTPPKSADIWTELLLELSHGSHEPWCLVVEDLSKPAFFQPPPCSQITDWSFTRWPDERDILVTSRAHDVKTRRTPHGDVESWVYALCTLQTMQGYPGRGYNGISRMKGGYGNRPRVGLARSASISERFVRDLAVLQSAEDSLLSRGYRHNGIALVWVEPWDGGSSLEPAMLAPHFIEVCQRIRCSLDSTGVRLSYATSTVRRCVPSVENGDVGDAWTPIERDAGALTVGPSGFSYRLLTQLLLSGDFEQAPAQESRPEDAEAMLLVLSAMARGQGKTEGIHERVLPLPGRVRRRLGKLEDRAALGLRATAFVQRADDLKRRVLFPALKALVPEGAPVQDRFDAQVDELFFVHLFASIEQPDEVARLAWERVLEQIGRRQLSEAIERCALGEMRFYAAVSRASFIFDSSLRRLFPDLSQAPPTPVSELQP